MYLVIKDAVYAFANRENFKRGNDEIKVVNNKVKWYVYGNCIAIKDLSTGELTHSSCGYSTKSTKNRLNALHINCHIHKGKLIYDDTKEPVNSKLIY